MDNARDANQDKSQQGESSDRAIVPTDGGALVRRGPGQQDEMLSALGEFEAGLKALKQMYSERQFLQAKVEQREVDLVMKENELQVREQELATTRRQLEERNEQLAKALGDLSAREDELESKRRELAEHVARVSKSESEIQARSEEQKKFQGELERFKAEAERLSAEMRQRQEQQDAGLAEQLAAIRKGQEDLDRSRAEQERARAEFKAETERVAEQKAEAEAMKPKLAMARKEIELAARKLAEVEHRRVEVAAEAERVAQQRAEVESLQVRLEAARDELEEATRATAEVERRKAEVQAEAERVREARAQMEPLRAELGNAREEVEQAKRALATIEERRAQVAAEVEQLVAQRQDAAGRQGQLADAMRELDGVRQAHAKAMEDAAEKQKQVEHECKRAAELEQKLAQALEDAEKARAEASQNQSSDTSEADKVIEALRDRLKSEIAARHEATQKAEMRAHELERVVGEMSAMQRELQRARTEGGTGQTDERLAHRLNRLRQYKQAAKARADKVRVGGDALRKRFELCEQVLTQRQELFKAHEVVVQAQRKLQKQQASGRTMLFTACVSITVGVMAVLSWAIARQVVPGTYAATTVVKADGRGRELMPEELAEWQRFHEELLVDPRFADTVAQRMSRKGMADLSSPAKVADLLKTRFSATSGANGELVMELRGSGQARTARELDTISTALASEANASRTRMDGGTTTPPPPASVSPQALDKQELYAAGVIFGAGMFVLSVIGSIIWRRLATAKTKFEQESQVAATLDESRWPDPKKMAA